MARGERAAAGVATPETYLGAARAAGWANGPVKPGEHDYGAGPDGLGADRFAYGGTWDVSGESAAAGAGASIEANFKASRVFLVLGSPGRARQMRVLLDGEPLPDALAGEDVSGGVAEIGG